MKKNIKNNYGFTLVEILAVIIILSLILILVLPKITNAVNNYSNKTDELTLNLIKTATKQYLQDNLKYFPEKNSNIHCVRISDLVEDGYLKGYIEYGGIDITNTKAIKVVYNNGFELQLINKNECVICDPVDDDSKTTGNVPAGNFEAGDEYTCKVKNDQEYNFLVLGKEGKNVNLIMNENLGETVAWSNSSIEGGPVDALIYLESNTSDWSNINLYDYMLIDDSGNNYSIIRSNVRARLLTYEEAINLSCIAKTSDSIESDNSCPIWLYGNFTQPPFAYWLSSSVSDEIEYAWYLTHFGDLRYTNDIESEQGTNITTNSSYGVRPVISVPTSKFSN